MKNKKTLVCITTRDVKNSKFMLHQNEDFVCHKCDSTYLVEILHPERLHHGHLKCNDCGQFVRWIPKPKPLLGRKDFINALLLDSKLNSWERSFLRNIKDLPKLSPRQTAKLNQISFRITGATYENTPATTRGQG